MDLSERKTDQKILAYLRETKMKLPKAYTELVKAQIQICCAEDEKEQRKGSGQTGIGKKNWGHYGKPAAVLVFICAAAAGTGGVYAAISHVQQRMESLSEEEKENLAEEAKYANADVFSRELTGEERIRLNELLERYQTEGLFPEREVLEVSDVDEVVPNRVCFLPETSTFYLPDAPMKDEQLLELIDFYYKRDYSLATQDVTMEYQQVAEVSQEEAVRLAGQKLKEVYGIEPDRMVTEIEYHQMLDANGNTMTSDQVSFSAGTEGTCYSAAVDLQDGRIRVLTFEDREQSNYSKSEWVDMELCQEQYPGAEKMARAYLGSINGWGESRIEYLAGKDGRLHTGIVNYIFRDAGGDFCVVSYSCVRGCFYEVRSFTEEEQEAREQRNAELAQRESLDYVSVEITEVR